MLPRYCARKRCTAKAIANFEVIVVAPCMLDTAVYAIKNNQKQVGKIRCIQH